METLQIQSGRVHANGAELYYELRGDGPPLLLIAGGLADAGQFTRLGAVLAEQCRVITYDRRGNSRSPAPAGWDATTVHEQADDAAALLEALGISATSVYGHSIGGPIALDLGMRRPELVHALILQDPAMMSVLADPGSVMAAVGPVIEEGMKAGGPAAAADAFYHFAVGDALNALEPATYERMKADGGVLFGLEFQAISGWRPDEEALRRTSIPVLILCGQESPPFFREAAEWLSGHLGAAVEPVPGGHGAPFDHASYVAARVTRFVRQATP